MLSARELDLDQNPAAAGFVNQRIVYTHGIGVAMVPVNEVANEGQPRLFIRNLPPVSSEVRRRSPSRGSTSASGRATTSSPAPARPSSTSRPAKGEGGADPGTETRWTGTTGIDLDTTLARLLFALRFRDLDLLISDQVTAESQLLFHRSLADRLAHRPVPALRQGSVPRHRRGGTAGLRPGRLHGLGPVPARAGASIRADPDSSGTRLGDPFNYIRNSVKITMDAYDGTMHFYVADDQRPAHPGLQGVFPTLFEPLSAMPDDLRAHVRVPEELFNVQTRVFGRYHVRDPLRFFQSDDLWTVPTAQASTQSLPIEAYYVIMRMPGESEAEFLLLQPMVPLNRPNMIAWVAARNDAPNYGTTRVYRFPAETTIFGPAQIEARIDQDPIISEQFTLWRNSGSDVIRGNLIVVPVGDSLLYLQPIYLQSPAVRVPRVPADRRRLAARGRLGQRRSRRRSTPAGGRGQCAGPTEPPTPTPTPVAHPRHRARPRPSAAPDRSTAAGRRPRPHRLRQPPLRAGPGGAARRGLRPVRRGDRPGRGRSAAARRARTRAGARVARAVGQPRAMTVGATLVASFLLTLARPRTWPLALATFLLRGGIVLVLAPIVVLPSAVGVGNVLTPLLSNVVFRGDRDDRRACSRSWVSGRSCGCVVGGLIAAAAESELARTVARTTRPGPGSGAARSVPAAHPARPGVDRAAHRPPALAARPVVGCHPDRRRHVPRADGAIRRRRWHSSSGSRAAPRTPSSWSSWPGWSERWSVGSPLAASSCSANGSRGRWAERPSRLLRHPLRSIVLAAGPARRAAARARGRRSRGFGDVGRAPGRLVVGIGGVTDGRGRARARRRARGVVRGRSGAHRRRSRPGVRRCGP